MMFQKARLRLTAFYLLIVMTISIVFSLVIYRGLTLELGRGLRMQAWRILSKEEFGEGEPDYRVFPRRELFRERLSGEPVPFEIYQEVFDEARKRIAWQLALINLGIFVFSGGAGYFLAGRTLRPIAEMVEAQKRFVADASHELRTPLTAIKTATEVALRDKKLNLQSAKAQLTSTLEEIDTLKSLTDYFLKLTKYQDSRAQFPFEPFRLSEACEEAISRLRVIAKERKIRVVGDFTDVTVEANKTSITELVSILLDNAICYSREHARVIVHVGSQKNSAFVRVEDFGIGIQASDIPHVFTRFYRADSSRTKKVVKGYGLGLSIAKSIVELHRGKIEVQSTVDRGSTFTVWLPLKQKKTLTRPLF
ncbi:MAG: hypothetical protein A2900_00640 [Candidatus Chisholmbacteria bacterium RIFCSPLOWO2_01_FULL_50_28]|nr:MAG: hypothetical protein A2900_00640 [Candidatus Chisholmbacteria bacterium RIFCSPLOWO2_01_FULL_50_28]